MMERKPDEDSKPGTADSSPTSEMEFGVLQRGEGIPPLVGLGGSADSIAPLQEFFAAMPADSGMAFVVIMHISPPHESTLAEMFQQWTAMPVVAATDGVAIEPNCVYVISPGKFLAAEKGHLRLTEVEEHRGKRVAVDYFFRTLAETHGSQALAVVFSGAGGEGSLGLKRIKELGGLTIAQDPDEAEHPDMPRSAIATGVVDWVLRVTEMPEKMIEYVKGRGELKIPADEGPHPAEEVQISPDEHETALRNVLSFLHTRTGSDFSCYKRATILRRIERRMRVNGLADLSGYLVYLRTHQGEAAALQQELLISVTNFFRDPAAFAALEQTIPELFKGKVSADTVRVWVAGCATGEEAYSIAMLLSEHANTLAGPPQIQVFATDLDEDVIREAREGLYPETIVGDVSEERLRNFFIHEHGGYRVRRTVRELVLFAPHDLLKDSPFSRLDLISCRNLLIYLNRDAQTRAFDIFHFALRSGGRLFLGTSEAVDEGSPLFAVLDKKQRLYAQLPGPKRLVTLPAGPGTLARSLAPQERTIERTRERPALPERISAQSTQEVIDQAVPFSSGLPPGELHYRLIERFSPPSILVNSAHDIVHLSDSAGRFLQFSGGEPTRNLLRLVNPMLRVDLRAALYAAAQTPTEATAFRVPVEVGDARSMVDIRVTSAADLAPDFLLVVFEEHPADGAFANAAIRSADAEQVALHLERELLATKALLQDKIEQSDAFTEELKASNEELHAINEELRSATEELETSREELQSINEELTTVNDELKSNVDRLAQSNSDLQNLMAATQIPTIFLDRELRIKRFTPSAKTLFNLISTDLGRPLSDLSRQLDYPEIAADAEHALKHLQPAEREVGAGERWYIARVLPYRTADDHIAGVVLSFVDITEQKRAEQRLAESEARYRAIGESIDYGVWVCDPTGRNTYASESFLKMVGITQQECSDFGWGAVLHPDDAEATVAAWKECVETEGRWERVHRFKGVDGEWHHVLARGVPLRDATGQSLGWAGINLDISRMMQTEQESARISAESESQRRLYETVLTNTPDFVYVFSLDHRVLYANDALIAMWGRGREGAIGKTFLEIGYEPWHAEMHDREIDQVRTTKQPIRGEVPFHGTNGRRIYDYIFVPVIGADGEVEAVAGTTRDVTDRKQIEKQLQEGQEQLDFALAAADLGQWSLNLTDHTARRTLRHDHIFGYDALLPDWTYETFLEHVVPDDRAAVDAAFQEAVANGSPWAVECRIRRADGAVRHIWTKALIRHDADGEVEWMLGIVGDVTDRRQSEERQAYLVRLADALRPLSDPVEVQAEASRLLGEHLRANRVVYFEIRGDEYVIERDFTYGVQPLAGRYPVSSFGQALLSILLQGRTVIEADATTKSGRSPEEAAAFAAIQIRGHVDVPLVKDGRFVAGMTVHVAAPRDWTQQEVAIIEEIAERTWAAVERVRAEAALRHSEERLRMALTAARMVAWEYDPASGEVLTSENAAEVYGFSSGEGMGKIERGFDMLHPEDVDRHKAAVEAAVESGEGFTSHFRIVRPDGNGVQWMEEWGHAVRDEAGKTIRLVGVNKDITARKLAEAAMRESEERLAFVRRSSGVGFWYCDLPFNVLQWDELVKAHFHLPSDAVVTIDTFYERIHPDDREPTRLAIEQSMLNRTPYNVDYRTLNPDTGAMKWVRAIGRTFYAADGTPMRFDGVTLDISDQKRAESRLRESEERFRLMADAAPVLIWLSGTDKLVSWYNRQWLEFTGRTMEEEVGKGATEVVHPDDLAHTLPLYFEAFEARAPFSMEYRLLRHDGEYRWVTCNGVPRYRSDGEFDGYIGSCLDITDYKNAMAELEAADRRKDEFLATLAHELRNPLAPISSGLEIMRKANFLPAATEQTSAIMERQLKQMVRLVDDLMDVSRISTGKMVLRKERVTLATVVESALETSRQLVEQMDHSLTVRLPEEPVVADVDPTRLAQVFSNLLNNAAKYTERGGQIWLTADPRGTDLVVSVKDTGIGIAADQLAGVFDMFSQVNSSLERSMGGLGIGLMLVRRLVEMHGGSIEARSDGPGKGSEFVVHLPVVVEAMGPVAPEEENRTGSEGTLRILIVDDTPDIAYMLTVMLDIDGYSTRAVHSGEDALAAFTEFRPEVILLDIGLPGMSGYDVCRRIRQLPGGKGVRIIAQSGWGSVEDRRQSQEAGFDHHLVKPVPMHTLLKLMQDFEKDIVRH